MQSVGLISPRLQQLGLLSWRCVVRGNRVDTADSLSAGENKPNQRDSHILAWPWWKVRTSYLMFAYCCEQSVDDSRRIFWILWMCTPLQSKTILNSCVLGYGRLNGHVASIVSMFSKRKVLEMNLYLGGTWKWKWTMYLGGTDGEVAGCFIPRIFAKKTFFKTLSLIWFIKPRDTAISTRETI